MENYVLGFEFKVGVHSFCERDRENIQIKKMWETSKSDKRLKRWRQKTWENGHYF